VPNSGKSAHSGPELFRNPWLLHEPQFETSLLGVSTPSCSIAQVSEARHPLKYRAANAEEHPEAGFTPPIALVFFHRRGGWRQGAPEAPQVSG